MTTAKTRQTNRLRALLLSGDDVDRGLARGKLTEARLHSIARRRGRSGDTVEQVVRRAETRRLALAIDAAVKELVSNKEQPARIVESSAPRLLTRAGVGLVSAGQAIVTWSHHGRCRSDSAFAALAGASLLAASSGRTVRHRLNRGGDRQLNRALHDLAKTRWRFDPAHRRLRHPTSVAGKPDREIRRSLKHYIARELFRALQATDAA